MRKILSVFSSRRKGAGNGVPVTTQMFQNFFSCTKLWNFDLKSIVRMTTKKHFEAEVKYSNKAVDARHDSTSHIKSHRRHQVTPSCQQTPRRMLYSWNIPIKNSRVSVFESFSSRTTRGATRSGSAWHKCNVESLLITFLLVDEKWMLND